MDGTMKALMLRAPGQLCYEDVPLPRCGEREVLVRLERACICNGSDPGLYLGHTDIPFPFVFGHEACGVIVHTGAQVTAFRPGERVSWWFTVGAFAEYVAVAPEKVCMVRVPDTLSIDAAPVLELAVASSRAALVFPARGKRVLIIGLGPSGLLMAQMLRAEGAEWIAGWDLYESRRALGFRLGCDQTCHPLAGGVSESFDVVIDAMGDDLLPGEETLARAIGRMREGGMIISYGHPVHGRRFDPYFFQSKRLSMRGPENRMPAIRALSARVMSLIAAGALDLHPLVTARVPLRGTRAAFMRHLTAPEENLKIVIDCTQA